MRISTRFTVLSVSITTLAALIALTAILLSEFNSRKAILNADIAARVAQGGEWARALHFSDVDGLQQELEVLLLSEPLLAGAASRNAAGDALQMVGNEPTLLPRPRTPNAEATSLSATTLKGPGAMRSAMIGGLELPYYYGISVPILSTVNPLTDIADAETYRVTAARNSTGARFVVGYVEVYAPLARLLIDLLPRANTLLVVVLILVVVAFLFVRSTVRRISRPMEQLATTADDISSGKIPRAINISGHRHDEIGDIANVLNGVIQGVHKMTAQLNVDRELMSLQVDSAKKQLSVAEAQVNQTRNRLKRVAYFDPVTSLPNRRLMLEQLNMLMLIAQREKRHLGVLVIDVENLRRVNESLGHEAGDSTLRTIASRLKDCLRSSDVVSVDDAPNDISRIGNNEFCAVLHGINETGDAIRTASRVYNTLSAPMEIQGASVAPVIKVGVAVAPEHGKRGEDLLRAADIAVTAARQRNLSEPLLFSRELDDAGSERFLLEADLRKANFDREFELHYQPQIDCDKGLVCGAEALIRWNHPKLGNVPPFKFIPIAEESGLIIDLGNWIIERAFADLADFRERRLDISKLSINISALQLTDELIDVVRNALTTHRLPADSIQLELTESLLVQDVDAVLTKLGILRNEVGVRLSVDDFGTGYSSLAYLAKFPLNELKVDRSFVVGMEADESAAKVTGAIIAMAKQLGLEIVVEGVDNPLQLQRLGEFGASVIQGFLFSRPLPKEALTSYIESQGWQDVLKSLD
ncbi:MAG: EAL domain-containing protein [Halieaceae bacterium]|jgi:diguanylate cyclase (GGDEF)-like protein|nr:EAL domain-containing protein [Halieaceae bacterium]